MDAGKQLNSSASSAPETGFALAVQQLPYEADRVLVLSEVASYRSDSGWFTQADVREVFEALRIPEANISRATGRLRDRGLIRRHGSGGEWALTPMGRQRVRQLVGNLDAAQLQTELHHAPGAEFGQTIHTVIPPSMAPVKWRASIMEFLDRYPFDSNVFCMTRFPEEGEDAQPDPVNDAIRVAREALSDHGLTLHLASDQTVEPGLLGNVAAYIWACRYGVAFFEDRLGESLNYNMVTEVGSMLTLGRRCALLKDRTAPNMPTDLVGQIYKPVDFDKREAVAEELHRWAARDLGLERCPRCPPES